MQSLQSKEANKILILSTIIIHLAFILAIIFAYCCADKELQKQVITEQIVATTTTLSKLFYDSGLSIGAYSLTKNKTFIDRYQKLINQISPTIETLNRLVDKQPVKEISFGEINQVAQEALKQLEDAKTILNNTITSPLSDDQGEIRSLYKRVKALADQLQSKLDQLSQAEQEVSKNSLNNRRIDQILLASLFFIYFGFNLSVNLTHSNCIAANQNLKNKAE